MQDGDSTERQVENPLGGKAVPDPSKAALRASEAAAERADMQSVQGKSCVSAYMFYWSVILESPRAHKVFVFLVVVQSIWLVVSVRIACRSVCPGGSHGVLFLSRRG